MRKPLILTRLDPQTSRKVDQIMAERRELLSIVREQSPAALEAVRAAAPGGDREAMQTRYSSPPMLLAHLVHRTRRGDASR